MADLGEGEKYIPLGPTFVKELVNDSFVAYVNRLYRRPVRLTTFIAGLEGEILDVLLLKKKLRPDVKEEIEALLQTSHHLLKGHMNGGQKRRNKNNRRKSKVSRKKHRRKSRASRKKN